VDRRNVGVIQRCEDLCLAPEPRQPLRIRGKLLRKDLDRHVTIERGVGRLPHHTHPALADLLDEPVVQQRLSGLDTQKSPCDPEIVRHS
jgi:hypothetical protein